MSEYSDIDRELKELDTKVIVQSPNSDRRKNIVTLCLYAPHSIQQVNRVLTKFTVSPS